MSPTFEKEKQKYPIRVATHEEVINDPKLFLNTLKSLHSFMGTKFVVPVVAKKELDLHVLYVEVTKRGGYDKVVIEKKWREISSILDFSPTATSSSFVLKNHYLRLLYYYEQVYFFNSQGPVIATPSPVRTLNWTTILFVSESIMVILWLGPSHFDPEMNYHNKSPKSDQESISEVVGTIHAKFDCGYLVTVKLGQDLLSGVLYYPDDEPHAPSSPLEDISMAIIPYNLKQPCQSSGKRRRKKKRWGGDPSHPKPNRSGYNFFFSEKHSLLKASYPDKREREFTKMIGELWNNLSSEERTVYQNMGLRDKERYQRELREYNEMVASIKGNNK